MVPSADSKCPIKRYDIEGQIINMDTKSPLNGAKIIVFFDENEYANATWHSIDKHVFQTDLNGKFITHSWFDTSTASELLFGCSRKPKKITAIVIIKNYFPIRKQFTFKDLKVNHDSQVPLVKLPDILMQTSK